MLILYSELRSQQEIHVNYWLVKCKQLYMYMYVNTAIQ